MLIYWRVTLYHGCPKLFAHKPGGTWWNYAPMVRQSEMDETLLNHGFY